MEIVLGKTAGFCYGVKRAVEGSKKQAEKNREIYCLGELVHNKQVIYNLVEKGINFIDDIKQVPNNSKVIFRAHGVPKDVYEIAKQKNIEIIDYTCTKVAKVHDIAEEYAKKGFYIFITCSKQSHPEVIGTKSFCGDYFSLIENPANVEQAIKKLVNSGKNKLILIAQTTYSMKKFELIESQIRKVLPENIEFIVNNTICYATQARQDETEKMSKQVELMIIIGGKNSSNTQKLYEVALSQCKNSICIETKEELKNRDFSNVNKVGIMAGASTPQSVIEDVVNLFELQKV